MLQPFKLSRPSLAILKRSLRDAFLDLRSAHADEALAYAFGFKTHAALSAALKASPDPDGIGIQIEGVRFDGRIIERLKALGYTEFPYARLAEFDRDVTSGILMDHVMRNLRRFASHSANDNQVT